MVRLPQRPLWPLGSCRFGDRGRRRNYMFLEGGFMHVLGVMAAGALIFFVPLIVISMRNTAQVLGGAG